MDNICLGDAYGLKPMSLEEEANAPQNIKNTRNNKVRIIDDCNAIIAMMETIRNRAYRCPELDEDKHAKLVKNFACVVSAVRCEVDMVFRFGYN